MKTALVVLACLLLVLAACGQTAKPAVTPTTATGDVTEQDVSDLSKSIEGTSSETVDTSALDTLDSDLAAIDSLDI